MTLERTKVQHANPPEATSEVDMPTQSSSVRDQVSAYGDLAREVYAECKKGAEARKEMSARRNTSAE